MTTIFIAGSIKIKHLDRKFKERIDKIIASGFDVVVGDADGADTAIQTTLFEQGSSNTTANEVKRRQRATATKQCGPMLTTGRSIASPPILPPVHAGTSPRKTWPWPKRRTMD